MADFSLQLDPAQKAQATYQDLLIVNGDLVLTSDVNPLGTNAVLQDVLQRLRSFLGEWFLDNSQGVPWLQQILVKGPTQAGIDAILQNTILATPGVQTLLNYQSDFDASQRTFAVSFTARTSQGTVTYTNTLLAIQGATT